MNLLHIIREIALWPIGNPIESPQDKLSRIVQHTRESYEIRRYRENRAAQLKRTPRLILVDSQRVA